MKIRIIASIATVLMVAFGAAASAAEVTVIQKDKKFDKKAVTINKGDSIKIVNEDSIAHNIHSRGAGKFDLGVQKSGTSSSHVFASDGTFKIRCAIHPKMKLKVTVK